MQASPLTIAIGCFAAGSLAAVGIANAVSAPQKNPDSTTGVITACYKKSGGNVRFINAESGKKCKSSEKKVTFNQTGPQGAKGAQGAQGERGLSNAFFAADSASVNLDNILVLDPPPTKNAVVALNLPAGSYTVNASTRVRKTNATTDGFNCTINGSGGTVNTTTASEDFDPAGADDNHSISAVATYTNTDAGTLFFTCRPTSTGLGNGAGESGGATITATQVGTLTAS